MNLFQKLVEIRKEVVTFSKDAKSYSYSYVSGSQAIAKIRAKMDELEVMLVPSVKNTENYTYDYKTGVGTNKEKECTDHIVKGDMTYTWINAEEPSETLEVPWKLYGAQDDISKAFGSGLTYSERYFILKFFQAPTDDDDPDKRDTSNRKANKGYGNGLSDAQIKRLYAIAHSKGIEKDKVDAQVIKVFKKAVSELTKVEYDKVCSGYEKK